MKLEAYLKTCASDGCDIKLLDQNFGHDQTWRALRERLNLHDSGQRLDALYEALDAAYARGDQDAVTDCHNNIQSVILDRRRYNHEVYYADDCPDLGVWTNRDLLGVLDMIHAGF